MAMIAYKNPDIQVYVYDMNQNRINAWNDADYNLPIYEPGLVDVIKAVRGKNMFFTTEYEKNIQEADCIFVAVNTPTKHFGMGKGRAADMRFYESCARQIRATIKEGRKIIVEKSTVPTRTAETIATILNSNQNKAEGKEVVKFDILSNPEFLAEGTAVADLEKPDRVLIGGQNEEALNALADVYASWVPRERIITTNVWSSEMSKLVANFFLAQRISSINAISAICEASGANVAEVSKAIGTDSRIGPKFLNASVGFGGSCFQKDVLNLCYLAESYHLQEVADYCYQVIAMNNYQRRRFVERLVATMFGTITQKKITVFGFAFKKDTTDTRESSSIYICKQLLEERANVHIYDPKVTKPQILNDMKTMMNGNYDGDFSYPLNSHETQLVDKHLFVETDPMEAVRDSHAILIMTEWDEFKTYDYNKVFDLMQKPAYIFDGRRIMDIKQLSSIGFEVFAIGYSSQQSSPFL